MDENCGWRKYTQIVTYQNPTMTTSSQREISENMAQSQGVRKHVDDCMTLGRI
jgi:hypothetical protein